jgi:hypothetical protein
MTAPHPRTPGHPEAGLGPAGRTGWRRWRDQQPPTAAQLGYLRFLGHAGPVASRREASALIDSLKQQQRAARRQAAAPVTGQGRGRAGAPRPRPPPDGGVSRGRRAAVSPGLDHVSMDHVSGGEMPHPQPRLVTAGGPASAPASGRAPDPAGSHGLTRAQRMDLLLELRRYYTWRAGGRAADPWASGSGGPASRWDLPRGQRHRPAGGAGPAQAAEPAVDARLLAIERALDELPPPRRLLVQWWAWGEDDTGTRLTIAARAERLGISERTATQLGRETLVWLSYRLGGAAPAPPWRPGGGRGGQIAGPAAGTGKRQPRASVTVPESP